MLWNQHGAPFEYLNHYRSSEIKEQIIILLILSKTLSGDESEKSLSIYIN